ncbi:MAG: hypothetical protein K9G60_00550 [Pseudolabrys sp.]|nr:hypothetical protein [Pseudolabrys sp.]
MGRQIAPFFVAAAIVLTLAACADKTDYLGKPKPVEPNIYPANYRKEILLTITPLLIDPTNVRDAYISEPALNPVGKEQRYTVCVRANSRDGVGQYTGSIDRIAYFFGGQLNQLIDATPEQCGNAAYKPFTELQNYCLGKSCK